MVGEGPWLEGPANNAGCASPQPPLPNSDKGSFLTLSAPAESVTMFAISPMSSMAKPSSAGRASTRSMSARRISSASVCVADRRAPSADRRPSSDRLPPGSGEGTALAATQSRDRLPAPPCAARAHRDVIASRAHEARPRWPRSAPSACGSRRPSRGASARATARPGVNCEMTSRILRDRVRSA